MRIKLTPSQYRLLSRYCEDLSKAVALYNVAGYFLPSVLPAAVKPSVNQFFWGIAVSLTSFVLAVILIKKGEK